MIKGLKSENLLNFVNNLNNEKIKIILNNIMIRIQLDSSAKTYFSNNLSIFSSS